MLSTPSTARLLYSVCYAINGARHVPSNKFFAASFLRESYPGNKVSPAGTSASISWIRSSGSVRLLKRINNDDDVVVVDVDSSHGRFAKRPGSSALLFRILLHETSRIGSNIKGDTRPRALKLLVGHRATNDSLRGTTSKMIARILPPSSLYRANGINSQYRRNDPRRSVKRNSRHASERTSKNYSAERTRNSEGRDVEATNERRQIFTRAVDRTTEPRATGDSELDAQRRTLPVILEEAPPKRPRRSHVKERRPVGLFCNVNDNVVIAVVA